MILLLTYQVKSLLSKTNLSLSYLKLVFGLGALCHEALSNSETKEPRIFEVTQLKFTIRAT